MQHASERSVKHKSVLSCLGVPALLVLLLMQAPAPQSIDDDRKNIPEPKERLVRPAFDYLMSMVIKPAAQKLDVRRDVLNIFRSPKEADNVTKLDEISDSSWFTNRN